MHEDSKQLTTARIQTAGAGEPRPEVRAQGTVVGSEVTDNGTLPVPSFELPFSTYASSESREYIVRQFRTRMAMSSSSIESRRIAVDENFYQPKVAALTNLYPHRHERGTMGGVRVDTFVPDVGIASENSERVLLNLHGGSFIFGGGGPGGAAESIPIAVIGRIKVISVDYRLAPEHRFPAASEDVASVYREVLRDHAAENIGIYGCSAGGTLAAQAIPWFRKQGLPLPGAIGILCASTHRAGEGDSSQIWPRMRSDYQAVPAPLNPDRIDGAPYFEAASPKDPFVVPAASVAVLKTFPPTLFITGSRAAEMSSAAQSHLELIELGVRSQLLIFDGMEHGFTLYPIPEATRAHGLLVKFFLEHLGRQRSGS